MDLLTDLRNTVLRPVLKREVDDQVRHGRKERAHNLADEYDIDKSYIEDKARERFNDILGYTTKDQAA